uniref:PDZ domain-containing protein n=1 Tax=Anopheles melas TaxID=34690 RepID=A0A182UE58_9DIPT
MNLSFSHLPRHITRTAGWLPPIENWVQTNDLPYGWEKAIDQKGQPYYINHLNKTTTYEEPIRHHGNDAPPEPRVVVLQRSPTLGFGFVAGSEKPVIVRFVTEGGPSVNKLEPGDQILAVNGEDVKDAPRDHVIQLVRNCETSVTLLVCQPQLYNAVGRKSTLLSAGKKAKLKSRPIRVRFAESVCVNGAPLFPVSTRKTFNHRQRLCVCAFFRFLFHFIHLISPHVCSGLLGRSRTT